MKNDFRDIITKEKSISNFYNKNILITGANGLIGGALAEFFVHLNEKYNYNIKLYLTSLSKNPERIKYLISKKDVHYFSMDLSKDNKITGIFNYCFYCSGYAQPAKFLDKPIETLNLNVMGLYNTLDNLYSLNPHAKCVYLSSSEIYSGNKKTGAHKENDSIIIDPFNKRNFYILGKLGGENVINFFREKKYNAISARVSLCYGPGVLKDDNRVLSDLVRKGLYEDNIKLFDDGSATRRYLHISDFIKMILKISLDGTQPIYNVCGEEENTIFGLATIIGNYLNKKVVKGETNHIVSKTAPKIVWNSLDLYNKEFDKIKFKPFKKGVEEFIEWYKNTLK